MIQINNLEYAYGASDFCLRVDDLSIRQGEKVAIIGPSGSGKTTLLKLIAGAISVPQGTIRVGQTRVDQLSDGQRRKFRVANIGFVFQDFELLEYLSVAENILLPYLINSALKLNKQTRESVQALARNTGLHDKLARRPDQLSQGERQRVAVCRALIAGPSVLLADEPTGSLDPSTASGVLELLLEQATRNHATLLLVTHDHSLLAKFDRTIDMMQLQVTAMDRKAT